MIQRGGWEIRDANIKDIADENDAKAFIENVPPRDKRKNFEESRFRLLCIKNKDCNFSDNYKTILDTAHDAGWIGGEFKALLSNGSVGSALLDGSRNINLILQTPKDDMPFFSLSMTELSEDERKTGLDWVCLLFTSDVEWQSLLERVSIPRDFGALSIDFMFLPIQILKRQAHDIRVKITELLDSVVREEERLLTDKLRADYTKIQLFGYEKTHLQLQTRSRFVRELADNISKCFDEIIKRHGGKERNMKYSTTLRQRVEAQTILCKMMQPNLDAIPTKLEAQHRMVDAKYNAMMAEISFSRVEQARRDSSSMKAIAVVTLVFLPSTFIAAIFSMSMFNWLAGDTETVASNRLWIFFAISVPLTLVVLLIWRIAYRRKEREFEKNQIEFKERWKGS
ncbi:hypothetical protein F4804DRAFT_354092 [Jackrogersella minutella]|nr:hypothetical protein F4804DRAFT_354092 [Jackrogersella minutella]